MKASFINTSHIEGLLYQHNLSLKVSGENSKNPGTQFINGTIDIATDDNVTNIVTVHFTYVTAKTKSGSDNATFGTLSNIINGTLKSVMADGVDVATKLRIDSQIGLNEFYSNRTGTDELVSVKRNEGGFIHITQALAESEELRNTFKCDMLITGVRRVEADPDRNIPEYGVIKGYFFDFRKALLPVELRTYNDKAITFYENLEVSERTPALALLWGRQMSQTVVNKIITESAFGEPSVQETTSTRREFVVTGGQEPYPWDDESTMTVQEYKTALADREVVLAGIRQRQAEYNASRVAEATTSFGNTSTSTVSGFNF